MQWHERKCRVGGEWVHTQGAAVDMVVAGLGWKKALVATREGNSLLGSTKGRGRHYPYFVGVLI